MLIILEIDCSSGYFAGLPVNLTKSLTMTSKRYLTGNHMDVCVPFAYKLVYMNVLYACIYVCVSMRVYACL